MFLVPGPETSSTIPAQKGLLAGQRKSDVKGCSTQMLVVGSILAKRCVRKHGRVLWCTKYGLWTRQIKMIGQRKTGRNALSKRFKPPHGPNSGTLPLSLPMCLFTRTVLSFLLINTLLASLLSVLGDILFCKAEEPGPLSLTADLVVRIWCFHHHSLASVSS